MSIDVMRTRYCGEISEVDIKKSVVICGWVHFIRNFGGVIFFYIRDNTGFIQVVVDSSNFNSIEYDKIFLIKREFVVQVFGVVSSRKTIEKNLKNIQIEIISHKIVIINECISLPFYPDDFCNINEEIRLKYRYLDLRRKNMQFNLKKRSEAIKFIRFFLYENNFIEIETPILTKSTPEGARDYVVPSRINIGSFFSLPQSPQIFKQLLVIGGIEKYYQVAKCFRDEDLRSDRQPEFTQLDLEIAFINENYIIMLIENLISKLFINLLNVRISVPFFKLSYKKALFYFRSDKPDYRNLLILKDISQYIYSKDCSFYKLCKNVDVRVFSLIIKSFMIVNKIDINFYLNILNEYNIKNILFFTLLEKEDKNIKVKILLSNFNLKNIINDLILYLNIDVGDYCFIMLDENDIINENLSFFLHLFWKNVCLSIDKWYFSWIVDFPLFTWDSLLNKWSSTHHPFTSPKNYYSNKFIDYFSGDVLSRSYDLIMNGLELGGGSIRINNSDLQENILRILGMNDKEINNEFSFLINALKSGAPVFGGIALGLDRLLMILTNSKSIRDIIAFPKTQSANCILTCAPSVLSSEQLDILGISIILKY